MPTNDNEPGIQNQMRRQVEVSGHAALILVESLIHGLITRSVLTTEDSLDIVMSAVDVQADYAAEAVDGLAHEMRQSHGLLSTIAESLRTDITRPPARPPKPTLVDADDTSSKAPHSASSPHDVDGVE